MNLHHILEKTVPTRLRGFLTFYVIVGFVVCIVGLLVFAQLVDGVSENGFTVQLDIALANALHSVATAGSTSAFIQISVLGSEFLFAWCFVVAIILAAQKHWLGLVMWVITIIGGEILNSLLKLFFARPRPVFATPLVIESYYSFPSGHAMMSFIAYGMLAYLLCLIIKEKGSRFFIVLTAGCIIFLIGLSRIALGVHYLSDVIAGYSVASLWLVTCITAWRYIQYRRAPAVNQPPTI